MEKRLSRESRVTSNSRKAHASFEAAEADFPTHRKTRWVGHPATTSFIRLQNRALRRVWLFLNL